MLLQALDTEAPSPWEAPETVRPACGTSRKARLPARYMHWREHACSGCPSVQGKPQSCGSSATPAPNHCCIELH